MFFGFWIARGLFRGARRNGFTQRGVTRDKLKPYPYGKATGWLVLVIIVIGAAIAGGSHGSSPNAGVLVGMVVLICSILAIVTVIRACRPVQLPEPPKLNPPAATPVDLRAQADALIAANKKHYGFQAVEPVVIKPVPVLPPRRKPYKSLNARMDEAQADERLRRVAAILSAPCPKCLATRGMNCGGPAEADLYILDRQRKLIAHGARIGQSIKLGYAQMWEVKAQFNSEVPVDVMAGAL